MLQHWPISGRLWSVTRTGGFTDEKKKQRMSTQLMENVPHKADLTEGRITDQFRKCCQEAQENIPKHPKNKEEDTPQLCKTPVYSSWKITWTNDLPKHLFFNENQLQFSFVIQFTNVNNYENTKNYINQNTTALTMYRCQKMSNFLIIMLTDWNKCNLLI